MACSVENGWNDQFQHDLVYSSVNGYYFIRMLDNVMDGHGTAEKELLAMSAFFHLEFQSTYQRYFEARHPFWTSFQKYWLQAADAVSRETQVRQMDFRGFQEIAVNKLAAGKIPLTAVHYELKQRTNLGGWLAFFDRLAEWWQFADDLMDWHRDYSRGACTYLLCEATRRKQAAESVHDWIVREGFQWGIDTLTQWMRDLESGVVELKSEAAFDLIHDRAGMLDEIAGSMLPGMQALQQLAQAMR
jgi:hypothetical protein